MYNRRYTDYPNQEKLLEDPTKCTLWLSFYKAGDVKPGKRLESPDVH